MAGILILELLQAIGQKASRRVSQAAISGFVAALFAGAIVAAIGQGVLISRHYFFFTKHTQSGQDGSLQEHHGLALAWPDILALSEPRPREVSACPAECIVRYPGGLLLVRRGAGSAYVAGRCVATVAEPVNSIDR